MAEDVFDQIHKQTHGDIFDQIHASAPAAVPGMELLGGTPPPAPKPPLPTAMGSIGVKPLDPTPAAPRRNPRTGLPMRAGSGPLAITDAPTEGVNQMAEGAAQIANANEQGTKYSKPLGVGRNLAGGASKIIRGGLKTVSPLMPALAAETAPANLATGIVGGTLAGEGTEGTLNALAVAPEYSALAGDVAGLGVGLKAGKLGNKESGYSGPGAGLAAKIGERMESDPNKQLIQAIRPRNTNVNFEAKLAEAKPLIEAAQSTAGTPAPPTPSNTEPAMGLQRPTARPIQGIDDLIAAAKTAKNKIRAQFDALKPEGVSVKGDAIADRILGSISQRMEQTDPGQAAAVRKFAESYRGKTYSLDQLEQHLTEANAELDGFYRRSPHGQTVSATANLNTGSVKAEAGALRDALYQGMDQYGDGSVPRQLKHQYGSLIDVITEAQSRRNVALRQAPIGLADQAANLAASGESMSAIYAALSGHPLVAAGVAGNAAARKAMAAWIKDNNSTDGLIRRAFSGTATPEPWTRPRALIGTGDVITPPPPDTSSVRGRGHAPHEQVNVMRRALPPGSAPFTQGTSVPDVLGRPGQGQPYNAGLLEQGQSQGGNFTRPAIVTPPPVDTSFVRGQQGMNAPPFQRKALPPASTISVPPSPFARPTGESLPPQTGAPGVDPSGVRSIPATINPATGLPWTPEELKSYPTAKMARGGIVRKPTLATVGEAGPEAIVPLGAPPPVPTGQPAVPARSTPPPVRLHPMQHQSAKQRGAIFEKLHHKGGIPPGVRLSVR